MSGVLLLPVGSRCGMAALGEHPGKSCCFLGQSPGGEDGGQRRPGKGLQSKSVVLATFLFLSPFHSISRSFPSHHPPHTLTLPQAFLFSQDTAFLNCCCVTALAKLWGPKNLSCASSPQPHIMAGLRSGSTAQHSTSSSGCKQQDSAFGTSEAATGQRLPGVHDPNPQGP